MTPAFKKRLIKISIIILVSAFVLLNAVWGIHHNLLFGKYEKITVSEAVTNANVSAKDGLTFSVSKAKYLNFGGNLGIVDAENKKYLIVWPTLFNGNTYGFMMSDDTQTYNFIIDSQGNLLNDNKFPKAAQIAYEDNKSYAKHLISEFDAWTEAAKNGDKTFFDCSFQPSY